VKADRAVSAVVLGDSEDVEEDDSGFLFSSAFRGLGNVLDSGFGGFEGVLDGVGAADVAGVPSIGTILTCCFNSPYSFHSSISTRSCSGQRRARSKK
jgi:hypothetical protein